jgi:hypothetical protein
MQTFEEAVTYLGKAGILAGITGSGLRIVGGLGQKFVPEFHTELFVNAFVIIYQFDDVGGEWVAHISPSDEFIVTKTSNTLAEAVDNVIEVYKIHGKLL